MIPHSNDITDPENVTSPRGKVNKSELSRTEVHCFAKYHLKSKMKTGFSGLWQTIKPGQVSIKTFKGTQCKQHSVNPVMKIRYQAALSIICWKGLFASQLKCYFKKFLRFIIPQIEMSYLPHMLHLWLTYLKPMYKWYNLQGLNY